MYVSDETLAGLRVTFNASFWAAYEKAETQYQQFCMTMPSSTKTNVYGWVAQQLVMREWIGKRISQALSENKFEVPNRKFEATTEIAIDELEDAGDGDLAMYRDIHIPQLGVAAADKPDVEFFSLLKSNPVAFDGVTLFNDSHPAGDKGGSTYDNNFTLGLTADNLNTVWSNAPLIVGQDGEVMSIMYDTLIVPPQLYRTAVELVEATNTIKIVQNVAGTENVSAAGMDNVMKGWLNVITCPRLGDQATTWYLAKLNGPIKPFVFQDREPTKVTSRMSEEDPVVFEEDKFLFGAKRRFAIAPTLPFLIAKSTP